MNRLSGQDTLEKNIIHAIYHLIRRRWNVLAVMTLFAVAGALIKHTLFPRYIAVSKLIVRSQNESPLLMALGKVVSYSSLGVDQPFAPASDRYVKMLQSRDFIDYVKRHLGQPDPEISQHLKELEKVQKDPVDLIFAAATIRGKDETIEFKLNSPSPELSVAMSVLVARLGYKFLTEYDLKEIKDTEGFLRRVTEENGTRIRQLSEKLDRLRIQTGMFVDETGSPSDTIAMQGIRKIKDDISDTEVKISENLMLTKKLTKSINSGFTTSEQITDSTSPDKLYSKRGQLVDRLKHLKSDREILEARLQALNGQLKTMINRVQPNVEQNIFELSRKLDIEHGLSRDLNKQLVDIQMYQITVENKIRLHEFATASSVLPDSGLLRKISIACVLALFLTGLGIYVWEQFHPLLSDRMDFIQLGIRFLGGVPQLFGPQIFLLGRKSGASVEEALKRMYRSNVRSNEILSFQFLATRIMSRLQKVTGRTGGTLGVVSMRSGEGKTLICSNLAIALSMHNYKILYVDGDYLNFREHPFFEAKSEGGLYEVLRGDITVQETIDATQFPNLDFLSSGRSTTSLEIFSEETLEAVIGELKYTYDFIVFDTPAYRAGPESIMFNGHTDLTIVVGTPYETRLDELKEINDALESKGQKHIVGLLNRFSTPRFKSDYYYMARNRQAGEDQEVA